MDPGRLIGTRGYWVLELGCLLEGETLLVIAGYAAHRGYLDPLARFPSLAAKAGRVHELLDRYQAPAVLWTCLVAGIGWIFGHAAEVVLGDIRHVEGWILLGLAAAGVLAWWVRRIRTRRGRW